MKNITKQTTKHDQIIRIDQINYFIYNLGSKQNRPLKYLIINLMPTDKTSNAKRVNITVNNNTNKITIKLWDQTINSDELYSIKLDDENIENVLSNDDKVCILSELFKVSTNVANRLDVIESLLLDVLDIELPMIYSFGSLFRFINGARFKKVTTSHLKRNKVDAKANLIVSHSEGLTDEGDNNVN